MRDIASTIPVNWPFVQQLVQADNKESTKGRTIDPLWIPSEMARNAESVSTSWRRHVAK